jgi:hypothetical protein
MRLGRRLKRIGFLTNSDRRAAGLVLGITLGLASGGLAAECEPFQYRTWDDGVDASIHIQDLVQPRDSSGRLEIHYRVDVAGLRAEDLRGQVGLLISPDSGREVQRLCHPLSGAGLEPGDHVLTLEGEAGPLPLGIYKVDLTIGRIGQVGDDPGGNWDYATHEIGGAVTLSRFEVEDGQFHVEVINQGDTPTGVMTCDLQVSGASDEAPEREVAFGPLEPGETWSVSRPVGATETMTFTCRDQDRNVVIGPAYWDPGAGAGEAREARPVVDYEIAYASAVLNDLGYLEVKYRIDRRGELASTAVAVELDVEYGGAATGRSSVTEVLPFEDGEPQVVRVDVSGFRDSLRDGSVTAQIRLAVRAEGDAASEDDELVVQPEIEPAGELLPAPALRPEVPDRGLDFQIYMLTGKARVARPAGAGQAAVYSVPYQIWGVGARFGLVDWKLSPDTIVELQGLGAIEMGGLTGVGRGFPLAGVLSFQALPGSPLAGGARVDLGFQVQGYYLMPEGATPRMREFVFSTETKAVTLPPAPRVDLEVSLVKDGVPIGDGEDLSFLCGANPSGWELRVRNVGSLDLPETKLLLSLELGGVALLGTHAAPYAVWEPIQAGHHIDLKIDWTARAARDDSDFPGAYMDRNGKHLLLARVQVDGGAPLDPNAMNDAVQRYVNLTARRGTGDGLCSDGWLGSGTPVNEGGEGP